MIIYRTTDEIPVQIGDATFWVSPLSAEQKSKIFSLSEKMTSGEKTHYALEGALLTLQMSVKRVSGIVCSDGSPYELSKGPDGYLTRECAEELASTPGGSKVISLAMLWATDHVKNPAESVNEAVRKQFEDIKIDFGAIVKKKSSAPN